jgi:hypothetical protein
MSAPKFVLRLSTVLGERKAKEGSYPKLAAAITKANGKSKSSRDLIDRRKLQKVVEAKDTFVLSTDELEYLNRYLEPLGHGLAHMSILERPSVLEALARSGHMVKLLLGSKPVSSFGASSTFGASSARGYQRFMADWDVRALAEIVGNVNTFAPQVRFDIRDVLLPDDAKEARNTAKRGLWHKLLEDDGPSLVCLGSSRANPVAEEMLCRMMDREAFDGSKRAKEGLPFHFFWPEVRGHVFPSPFNITEGHVDPETPVGRALKKGDSGLATVDAVYVDQLKNIKRGKCYGLCVAQRRPRGQVWVVLAGVSGPATYAISRILGGLEIDIKSGVAGEPSPVGWAVVEASLGLDPQRHRKAKVIIVTDTTKKDGPHEFHLPEA